MQRQAIVWQRLEGLMVLAVSLVLFPMVGGTWLWFIIWFFLPDISLLGYLKGSRLGALCYNVTHSFFLPALLILAAIIDRGGQGEYGILIACVWAAHIGLDRALGFGLKQDDFWHTHLGKINKK
jgi:hypothetical protein